MALTREKVIGTVVAAAIFFGKPLLAKWYEKWIADTPEFESFLIKITFGLYHKKARRLAKDTADQDVINKKNADIIKNNELVKNKIYRLIAGIGYKYGFNRVTVSTYKFVGAIFPQNPSIVDFENMEISVTDEWTDDNTKDVAAGFQNYPSKDFSKELMRLHYSEFGFITIPDENFIDEDNLYGIVKSWRFRLGGGILDGALVMSFTYIPSKFEMDKEKIAYIKMMAKRIYNLKSRYL